MKTLMTRSALTVAILLVAWPALAIQSLSVSPSTVNLNVRVGIPLVEVNPALLPSRPTFRDLLGGRSPAVTFSPSSVSITWRPGCLNLNNPATSEKGVFRADGAVVATNNQTLSTVVACITTIPVPETISIPGVVGDQIAQNILNTRVPVAVEDYTPERLEIALERAAADAVAALTYERTWQASGSNTPAKTARVVFSQRVGVAGNIKLESSKLVAFDGSSSARGLSVLRASAPVAIVWTGTVEQTGAGSPLTLRSDGLVIKTRSGTVIGRNTRPLIRAGIRAGRAMFNETVNLTSTLLLGARQGGNGLIFERTLSDDLGNSFTARVTLDLSGPGQAEFAVTAIQCRFHDGARIKIVREGDPVHVVCDLKFDGPGGLLRGLWEEAQGGGSQLFFRPLQLYSNFVVGRNRIQVSRTFTAAGRGRHILRFRVQEPGLLPDQPEIQYFVGVSPDDISPDILPAPIGVVSPPPNSIARSGLEVSWGRVPDAADNVLVEFFTPDQLFSEPNADERAQRNSSLIVRGEPIAGLVVPADRSSAEISRLVMDHLEGSGRLYMRVSALQDGIMLAVSPLRRLHAP